MMLFGASCQPQTQQRQKSAEQLNPQTERETPPNMPAQPVPGLGQDGQLITAATPAAPLQPFFQRLHQLRRAQESRQAVTILHVGDSHVASDTMTGELRQRFQDAWGRGGRGYIYAGRPWKSYRQEGVSYDMQGKWQVEHGMSRKAIPPFGVGGIKISSSQAGDYFTRTAADGQLFYRAEIHYLSHKQGGQFKVYLDDREVAAVSTAHAEPQREGFEIGVYQVDVPEGAKSLKVEVVGDGAVHMLGTSTATAQSGVVYHSLGLNGARAQTFLDFDEALTIQEVGRLQPDLLILGFGTNEAYNQRKQEAKPEQIKNHVTQLTALIQRYKKASPQASCLVLLPMEFALKPTAKSCFKRQKVKRGKRWRWQEELIDDIDLTQHPECQWSVPPSLDQIRNASIEAANQEGCAIWDQYSAMGGPGSMRRWAQLEPPLSGQDGVHLRLRGYQQLGQLLYVDLMKAYQRWETTSDASLETTPWVDPEQAAAQTTP